MADEPKQIVVDTTHMKFKDVRLMMRMSRYAPGQTVETAELEKLFDTLDRLVVGGVDDYEITELPAIAQAVSDAIELKNDTKN